MDAFGFWFGLAIIAALLLWAYWLYHRNKPYVEATREEQREQAENWTWPQQRVDADAELRQRAQDMRAGKRAA